MLLTQPHSALAELLKSGGAYITIEEFRPFCAKNQTLLKPVFAVQDKLRNAAMGTAFWESMSKRKIELTKGHTVELENLMVHVSVYVLVAIYKCGRLTHGIRCVVVLFPHSFALALC